jgi:hypothetical protein
MFEVKDFFKQDPGKKTGGKHAENIGKMGKWGLHAVKILALLYTSYHGLSASWQYGGSSGYGSFTQMAGVVVTSLTALSIWLAWHNYKITGPAQSLAALFFWSLCILMEGLAVLVDSQMHAGQELHSYLVAYLRWGLPLSPIVALIGAVVISELDPEQLRARRQANERDEFTELEFQTYMTAQRVRMESQKMLANVQLNAQESAARQIASWAQSPEAQEALTKAAQQNAPALFRSIGVPLDHDHLTQEAEVIVIDPDPSSVAFPPPPPLPPTEPPDEEEEKLAEPEAEGGSENTHPLCQ